VARATALVTGLAAIVLALAPPARAAAPNYILVSGPGLAEPVLLADWSENLALLVALTDARRATGAARALARRPRLDLAEFWGWSGLPPPTKATKTGQHGTFYPAHGSQPAVIVILVNGAAFPRRVPAEVRRVFARHGIPLRL
jgi:hypothetical protein